MVSIKHAFQSGKGDGPDSTRVRPTAWNQDHDIDTLADGIVLGRLPGAGPGPIQEVPMGNIFAPGMVSAFAGAVAPAGWHLCNGQSLTRADNLQLYLAIGTFYGQGSVPGSTFAVPNLYGRTIAMLDPTGTVLTNATMNPNGNTLGAYGGAQQAAVPIGGAPLAVAPHGGSMLSGYINGDMATRGSTDARGSIGNGTGSTVELDFPGHTHPVASHGQGVYINGGVAPGSINPGTYSSAGLNMQPTMLMNWVIKG